MFYESSPANSRSNGANEANGASSPLRQMSNTQTTNSHVNGAPSSPLRQMTDTQSNDGDRTPRASGLIGGEMKDAIHALRSAEC